MKVTTVRVPVYVLSESNQNVSFRGLYYLAFDFSVPLTSRPHPSLICVLCMVEYYFWRSWSVISKVWKMPGAWLVKPGSLYKTVPPRFFQFLRILDLKGTAVSTEDLGKVASMAKCLRVLNIESCLNIKESMRCCMNFPQKLTCQILTNQNMKIGRRVWPTLDHGKKRSSPPVFLNNWLNFCVRGQFEIKILIVRGCSDINTTYSIWMKENKLEPAIIWKLVTCQQITLKKSSTSMGRYQSQWHSQMILVSGYRFDSCQFITT